MRAPDIRDQPQTVKYELTHGLHRIFYIGCVECDRQRKSLDAGGDGFGPEHQSLRGHRVHCTCDRCW